ncbi:ABC transporter permease [Saccharopolyspora erythraea]|uniref:ABC transporter permease n=1 Tax=Saccharopolyspora erythraea TaxID=1836 RepID=UPI001BAD8F6F|nr:ABC transporter permease [Saccharopolyspora erythraea]QUH03889.1 ABC transporter permease [Saccharopolyspora erythraea]
MTPSTGSLATSATAAVAAAGRRRHGPLFWTAAGALAALAVAALAAPLIAPHDPTATDFDSILVPPVPEHLLGTDQLGRDLLSRVLHGARTSLVAPLGVLVIATVIGPVLGVVAAWRGGWLDAVFARATDALIAFPGLLFAVLTIAVLGTGVTASVLALGLAYFPAVAKVTRSAARAERKRPYIEAYRVQGMSGAAICLTRLLPRVMPLVLGYVVVLFGDVLLALASLSYLGFGAQPPSPDWGLMVSEGQFAMLEGAMAPTFVPGLVIAGTVVAFNIVGVGIADRLGRTERS